MPGDHPQAVRTLEWVDGTVVMIDQRRLPAQEVYVTCRTWQEVAGGHPGDGHPGSAGHRSGGGHGHRSGRPVGRGGGGRRDSDEATESLPLRPGSPAPVTELVRRRLQDATKGLFETRPTAVNLGWALREMERVWTGSELPPGRLAEALVDRALEIYVEDIAACRAIGRYGAELIRGEAPVVLTHCNAGALATAGYGTALGVIRSVFETRPAVHVLVDETRPFLQGARLTAWELLHDGISAELITDSMAGHFLAQGEVTHVVVGADRIAANGDTANKIGTYPLSVLAREHAVPFLVAAPLSTVDLSIPDGSHIPIEERDPEEVTHLAGQPVAPAGIRVRNPAFDVTPARNITAIVTERGVARPPFGESLRRLAEAPAEVETAAKTPREVRG